MRSFQLSLKVFTNNLIQSIFYFFSFSLSKISEQRSDDHTIDSDRTLLVIALNELKVIGHQYEYKIVSFLYWPLLQYATLVPGRLRNPLHAPGSEEWVFSKFHIINKLYNFNKFTKSNKTSSPLQAPWIAC
jgi:hypothetical protein